VPPSSKTDEMSWCEDEWEEIADLARLHESTLAARLGRLRERISREFRERDRTIGPLNSFADYRGNAADFYRRRF